MDIILRNQTGINIVLDNKAVFKTGVFAEVFWQFADEPEKEPISLGIAPAGKTLSVPFDFEKTDGRPIKLFAVSIGLTGRRSVNNPKNAPTQMIFSPNLATATPALAQVGSATNTAVDLRVTNVPASARFRKIEFADNSGFTGATVTIQDAVANFGGVLPPDFTFTKASETSAVTRYFRVSHSSNGVTYGTASNSLTVTFANSGGTGGGTGATPPTLSGTYDDVNEESDLTWSNNGGSGTFTIKYSLNGGGSWSTAASGISSGATTYSHAMPRSVDDYDVLYSIERSDVAGVSAYLNLTVPAL